MQECIPENMLLEQEERPTASLHRAAETQPDLTGAKGRHWGRQTHSPRRAARTVPEIVSAAELPAQLVVEAPAHLAQPAPAEVTAEAVLVPVLVDGLQEVAVPDVLLAASTCQQGWGDLQHLIHWLPGKKAKH